MEIGNKILELRKKNNLSQEGLAEKVGVARQTISKWELGETSPDLQQAKKISQIFNVSLDELVDNELKEIDELVDNESKEILVEKTSNTEKLAGFILKLIKIILISLIVIPILCVILLIIFRAKAVHNEEQQGKLRQTTIECFLHDEVYYATFEYYENTGKIKESGGDLYLVDITGYDNYGDAYKAINIINDYVINNGGKTKITGYWGESRKF